MEHVNLPDAISHRQLRAMLEKAKPGDGESIEELLHDWSCRSERVLEALRDAQAVAPQGRSGRQWMALGALQAHLAMALRAGAAAQEH